MTILPSTLRARFDELDDRVIGPVFAGDDPRAIEEAATFNLAVVHHPVVVVGAVNADDVAEAVAWSREHGLSVAVQSTGHGAVKAVDGDALLITTSRMNAVSIDSVRHQATVGAGVRWSEVIAAAAMHGLAPLSGSSSRVGVVGYTLGGGIGLLSRQYGFAADLVTSIDLVTADGRQRVVDAHREPELFWAVRGGKGNFGIVTALTFGLVPVSELFAGGIYYAGEQASAVLHAYREWSLDLPDAATASIAVLRLPDVEEVPAPLRGRTSAHLRFAYNGPADEAEALLEPMRRLDGIVLQHVGPTPVTATDVVHQDPTDPMPIWEQSLQLRTLEAETIDRLLEAIRPTEAGPIVMTEIRLLGGALGRQPAVPNAVAGREGAYSVLVLGVLIPGTERQLDTEGGAIIQALAPWQSGTTLLNFLGNKTDPAEVAKAWRPEVHERLLEIKRRNDPDNLFRHGHALN